MCNVDKTTRGHDVDFEKVVSKPSFLKTNLIVIAKHNEEQ